MTTKLASLHAGGAAARAPGRSPDADRDVTLDALRGGALLVVVLGHWLAAVVSGSDGELRAESLLVVASWARWLTWLLQVMPVFFLVGGVVSAASWRRVRRRGDGAGGWLRTRAARLLHPTVPLLALWAVAAPLAVVAGGLDPTLVRLGSQAALVPLWFLAVYLVIQTLTPVLLRVYERLGAGRVLAVTIVAVTVVDVAHLRGVPLVGWANFLLVWSVPTLLGFALGDGALNARRRQVALAAGGAVALVALVAFAGYPVSMVGVDGAERSNTSPPSLVVVALAFAQTGLVAAGRRRLGVALQGPCRRRLVTVLARSSMGLYLWHLTAMVLVLAVAATAGLPLGPAPLTAGWWLARPLWVALLLLVTAPFVVATARYGRRAPAVGGLPGRAGTALTVAATLVVGGVIGRLVVAGMVAPGRVLPPLPDLAALVAGCAVLGVFSRRPRRGVSPWAGVSPKAAERGTK